MTWIEVAARHGVSERQARRVVERWYAGRPQVRDLDPAEVVRETLVAFAQDLSDLAVLAVETNNDAVRLGAIKARGDVFRSRIEVLRTIGRLPHDWAGWLTVTDTIGLLRNFVDVLRRSEVDDETLRELRTIIDRTAPPSYLEAAA